MTLATRSIVALLVVAGCASGETGATGGSERRDGVVSVVAGPGGEVQRLHVSPDGRFLVVETTGPLPSVACVYDEELRLVRSRPSWAFAMAFSSMANELVIANAGEVEVVEIQSLQTRAKRALPDGARIVSQVIALPQGAGWAIHSGGSSRVRKLDATSLGIVGEGELGVGYLVGAALDDATGLGVVVGRQHQLGGYDFDRMSPAFTVDLPCVESGPSVRASNGIALVGTSDGSGLVIRVDLRERRVIDTIKLPVDGRTFVACAKRTGDVAIAGERRVAGDPDKRVLELRYLERHDGSLREVASTSLVIDGWVADIELMERTRKVVIGGTGRWVWDLGARATSTP